MKTSHALAVLAVLSAFVWGPTVRHGFVWDDEYFVVSNTSLRDWKFLPRYFTDASTITGRNAAEQFPALRPIRNISYLLDFKVAGLNPAWWHFDNILLHTINAALVLLVARRMGLTGVWPVLAGAIFLVHPVQTETVAWVKGRDDILGAMFSLAAFAVWLGRTGRWRLPITAGLYLLACLSKEQCIALPLAIFAWEFWTTGRVSRRGWVSAVVTCIAGLAYLSWRHVYLGSMAQCDYLTGSLWTTMMTMTEAGARYLQLLLFPAKLLADYSGMHPILSLSDPRLWIFSCILLAVASAALIWRRRQPIATFGLVWALVMLLPMSNLVPMMQFMAERFLYLPLAGFAISVAALFSSWSIRAQKAAIYCAVILVASYSVRAAIRVPAWKDSRTLFAITVRDTPPDTIRPRRQYLDQLIIDGQYAEALPVAQEFYAYLQQHRLEPRIQAEVSRHLGFLLTQTAEIEEGKRLLREAMKIDPTYVYPYIDFGVMAGMAGSHDEALHWFEKALEQAPADTFALYNRGTALVQLGRLPEAESDFRAAMEGGYESKEAHRALAGLLLASNRRTEAVEILRKASKLWPTDQNFKRWIADAERNAAPQ